MATRLAKISRRLAAHRMFVVGLVVVVVHCLVPIGPLLYDDGHAIAENTSIRELANIPAFFLDPDLFSASNGRMYRPLVLTTLAIDHAIGAGEAWAFKLGNLVQHLALCLLLVAAVVPALLARVGLGTVKEDPRVALAAIVGTLCFAIHPLHVESLCLVSSRSEILAGLGFGIALTAWLRGAERGSRIQQVVGLAIGTAIACLAKEIGVLVPPAVILVDLLAPRLPVGLAGLREAAVRVASASLRAAPALGVVFGYLVLRKALFGVATASLRAVSGGNDPYSGGGRDLATQLEGMALFLPKALGLLVAPWSLSLDHTIFFGLGWSSPHVLAGAAAVALLLVSAIVSYRRRPLFAMATLVGFAFALPWIVIPLNVPFAEHRLYVPMLLASAPCAALWLALDRYAAGAAGKGARRVAAWAPLVLVVLLGVFASRSLAQQWVWRSKQALWASTLDANPRSFRALASLADVAAKNGRLAHACRLLERGNGIYPRYWPQRHHLLDVRVQIANQHDRPTPLSTIGARRFAERTLELAQETVEDRPKDPFVRLLVAKAYRAQYLHTRNPMDLRIGESWALSCLAMVEQKMLVFRTAAEVVRLGGAVDAGLSLFDASRERGLVNDDFEAHEAELLIEHREFGRGDEIVRRLLSKKTLGQPLLGVVLGLDAKSAAAQNQEGRWRRAVGLLAGLGYDTSSLPRPSSLQTRAQRAARSLPSKPR